MTEEGIDIGDGNTYDISSPNDLLRSRMQRFEIRRHASLYATDLKETALVTLILSWKGFTQTRHYSVPWTGSSGYAVVFPDYGQMGFADLWALYTEAHIQIKLDGEELTECDMRVASLEAREFDTLDLADQGGCDLSLCWLDEHGTRFSVPVACRQVTNSGKAVGYSPSSSYSTAVGTMAVYRRWKEIDRSATLETAPVANALTEYFSTLGETPFVELRNASTGEVYLFDDITPGGVSFNSHGMAVASLTVQGLNHALES